MGGREGRQHRRRMNPFPCVALVNTQSAATCDVRWRGACILDNSPHEQNETQLQHMFFALNFAFGPLMPNSYSLNLTDFQ